jgi:hypothetical protein
LEDAGALARLSRPRAEFQSPRLFKLNKRILGEKERIAPFLRKSATRNESYD